MKVLTAAEMQAADRATFEKTKISSLAVMESAARAVLHYIVEYLEAEPSFLVLCGSGNNAGDGYAIARGLQNLGLKHKLISLGKELKGDAKVNADSYSELAEVYDLSELDSSLEEANLVIDCLFGTGFKGKAEGDLESLIKKVNKSSAKVVSVDLPSGLVADSAEVLGEAIKADFTIALQCLKLCHVLFPATEYCGEVRYG